LHLETHSGKRKRKHVCSQEDCGAAYNYKCVLQQHERTHTGMKPYICPLSQCGKKFISAQMVKNHMATHRSLGRNHKCPNAGCNFRVNRKGNLTRHSQYCDKFEPICSDDLDNDYDSSSERSIETEIETSFAQAERVNAELPDRTQETHYLGLWGTLMEKEK